MLELLACLFFLWILACLFVLWPAVIAIRLVVWVFDLLDRVFAAPAPSNN
jgi:hypothetical protein